VSNTLSVVIPVFFNEGSLCDLFSSLQTVEERLRDWGMDMELVFVDDGSGDESLQELLRIKEKRPATKVVKLTRNFGAVKASKSGFRFITGDCFTVLAADLQDPPELILQMIEKWKSGSMFTVCVRAKRSDPMKKKIFSKMYYWMIRRIVASDYPRGGFDLFLLDSKMLPHFVASSKAMYTPILAWWLGVKPEIIFYDRLERKHGSSRWTFRKRLAAFFDVILGFSTAPLRVATTIGALVAFLSFFYSFLVVVSAVLGKMPVPGFATIVSLMSFLSGIVILMLGLIGEYISRIFDEVNQRPDAVIEKVY